jgi:DNA polymerase-3 subunit epsilon/oligoribonuclease
VKGIFLDIETDGLDPDLHVALEVAVVVYELHTMLCIAEYQSFIRCSEKQWAFGSDPRALAINGITYEDVKNAKDSTYVCEDLTELFLTHEIDKTNSVFICQNPSFDRGFFPQIMPLETQEELELPYHWIDLASMYFASSFLSVDNPIKPHNDPKLIRLSKDSIAQHLGLPPEQRPHRALNGVKHLISCYRQLFSV